MKRLTIALLVILALTFSLAKNAVSVEDSANHTVTVHVDAISKISVSGTPTLTIDTATTAGSQPDSETTTITQGLKWTTNETSKKITVQTNNETPVYTLKVVAESVTGGTAAIEQTVSYTTAGDFVTGIAETLGVCDIKYTATATASAGTGEDVHLITYTITDVGA